jgi:hypothetical protein
LAAGAAAAAAGLVVACSTLQARHAHGHAALQSNFTSSLDIRLSWLLVLLLLLQVQLLVADLEAALPAALKPSNCSWGRFLCSSKRCRVFTEADGQDGLVQVRSRAGQRGLDHLPAAGKICFLCSSKRCVLFKEADGQDGLVRVSSRAVQGGHEQQMLYSVVVGFTVLLFMQLRAV